jgi:hypothetical protein
MAGDRSYTSKRAKATDLDIASKDRLAEAEELRKAGRYASAIAMGLYALEIRLKERICRRLDLTQLPTPFEIHDLDGLLVLAGLSRRISSKPARPIKKNWNEIVKQSKKLNALRYEPSSSWTQPDADAFFLQLTDPTAGVLPWILSQP